MKIERITNDNHPLYEIAIETYKKSFPFHEQRETFSRSEILCKDSYHFDAVTDDDLFVGSILYWEVGDFLYIEHFWVSPDMRNKHYGQRILEEIQTKPLIFEIDPVIDEISRRRQNFYERCGFVDNPYQHVHPPYHKGYSGHQLVVMSFPRKLTTDEYEMFNDFLKNTIMKDAYR